MDRKTWLKEQRRETEEGYDKIWAPLYGEKWGTYENRSHLQFIETFLRLLPQPGAILDAACGAGRYTGLLLEAGHAVVGIDQAQGMLDRAQIKFPTVALEKIGLQEMAYVEKFDGAICMDALEHVSPEDWPVILSSFCRALKPQGYLYFTVELAEDSDVDAAFEQAKEMGLPVVHGEWINDGVYHYYPSMSQVREWLGQAGFEPVDEGEGDGYHHFVARKIAR
jgi:2-polyprenyl-3-methyl-5-hydroxy-6-metoxy-1,4-benzoquinol methylase